MTVIRETLERTFDQSERVRRVVAGAAVVLGAVFVFVAIRKAAARPEVDLHVILAASRAIVEGCNIYSAQPGPYVYLPLIAVLFIPFSFLPQQIAVALWMLVDMGLISWSLITLVRMISSEQNLSPFERWGLHLFPVIFCLDAISAEIGAGQLNGLILALSVLGLVFAQRSWNVIGGAFLGLAAVAKVFSLPLMAFAVLRRNWGVLLGGTFGVALGLIIPVTLIGFATNYGYVSFWLTDVAFHHNVATHPAGFLANASLQAVAARLFDVQPAYVYNGTSEYLTVGNYPKVVIAAEIFVPFIPVGLLTIYSWLNRSAEPLVSWSGGVALAFALAPMISPLIERPHSLMLLPAYVYVTYLWLKVKLRGAEFYALIGAAVLLPATSVKLWVGEPAANISWALGSPSWGSLCLALAIFCAPFHIRTRQENAGGDQLSNSLRQAHLK
jgi:hypothetical protein